MSLPGSARRRDARSLRPAGRRSARPRDRPARPEGERTSKSTSIVSPSNVASGFGERIVTTGGSLAATEAVSVLRLAASLAWRDRFAFVAGLQHQLDDVGPVETVGETRGGKEVGLLRPAAVDVPADQILAAGRRHVIAGRRPGDPFARGNVDEQREQLRAVRPAQPADRAVAIGDDEDLGRPRCSRRPRRRPDPACSHVGLPVASKARTCQIPSRERSRTDRAAPRASEPFRNCRGRS